jgi:hypothetical protein
MQQTPGESGTNHLDVYFRTITLLPRTIISLQTERGPSDPER